MSSTETIHGDQVTGDKVGGDKFSGSKIEIGTVYLGLGESLLSEKIGDLSESLLALANSKPSRDRDYFENFIKPIWSNFNQVHEDYKQSFQKYITMLREHVAPITVADQLTEDSILSADARSTLDTSASDAPSPSNELAALLTEFRASIKNYFGVAARVTDNVESNELDFPSASNIPRRQVALYLLSNESSFDERQAIRFILSVLQSLQANYSASEKIYQRIKNQLLAPSDSSTVV